MSTSLNDTVAEVYREVMIQTEEKSILRKLRKKPLGVFRRMRQYVRRMLCKHGRETIFGRKKRGAGSEMFNVFQPTDKVFPEVKIAVYTVITGNYDDIKTHIYMDDTIDYYLITDAPESKTSAISQEWRKRLNILPVPGHLEGLNNAKKNRYIKLHPDEILSEENTGKKYDYTVYLDGSIRITCDIKPLVYSLIESGKSIAIHKHPGVDCIYDEAQNCWIIGKVKWKDAAEQMKTYRQEGMPEHFGLHETSIIIRKCNDPELHSVMNEWWKQIERYSHRDQLSLSYALWKTGHDISYVFSLGNKAGKNPYFLMYPHN